jgi:hypothetical protein
MAEVLITYKAEAESLEAVVKDAVKGNVAIAESATKAGQVASKAFKDVGNSAKAAFGSQEVKKSLDNQVKSIDKLAAGSVSLKTQLKNLKAEISALDAAGQGGTKQFNQLAISAAKLEDQIGDTNQRVKVLASDTFKFDAALGAIKGLAAGFAVAQGAVALFAEDNEELQEAIAKTNAAIAILTGLQEIANIVTGQGAEKIGILALAQTGYELVVGKSTGALKLFKLALAGTGVGLLIIGIGLLIQNFDKIKDAISGTSDSTRAFEAATKSVNAELAKTKGLLNETALAQADLNDKLAVSQGNLSAKQAAINKANRDAVQENIKDTQALFLEKIKLERLIAGQQKTVDDLQKKQDGFAKNEQQTIRRSTAAKLEAAKTELDASNNLRTKVLEDIKVRQNANINAAQTEIAILNSDEKQNAIKKAEEDAKTAREKAAEDAKNAREKLAQAELDIFTRTLDEQSKVLNDSNNEILALEKSFTDAKFKKGSAEEIEQQKKLQNSIEEIKKQATAKNIELEKQSQEKILAAKLEAAKAGDNATLQVILASLEVQQKLELESAETTGKSKLEITQKYGVLIANVNKQIAEANVNTQVNNLKRLEIVEGSTLDRRIELINIEAEKRKVAAKNSIVDETERNSAIDLINAETQEAITKENKTEFQKRTDEVFKYAEAVGQTLTALNDLSKQLSENRIAEINTEKEAQLAAINESSDTERSKIRQREALELRTQKKIAEEKTKQAKADKALALFNVAINTAVAISKAAPNPFLIALAAGVGIAQAAIILAKPIPKFAQGGVVGGQLHSQGGTQIEAEKDEYIVKRSQSVKHRKELDAINTSTQAFRNMINERYVRPAIMNYVLNRKQDQGVTVNASLNSKAMESELRGLRKDIRNSRVRSINNQLDSRYSWQ